MKDEDINVDLQKLQGTLDEIKALLAWEDLKRAEARATRPGGLILPNPVDQDIQNQYSGFLATSVHLHARLSEPQDLCLSENRYVLFRRRLARLQDEFRCLKLTERFIKF